MDNQEAKFILQAYRANGADAADPAFKEALAQAQSDPSLKQWFEREQTFDRAVAAKIRAAAVPPSLRAAILAGARAGETKRSVWRQPVWLAAAACIAVMLGGAVLTLRSRSFAITPDTFAAFALEDKLHGHHGGHGQETAALQAALADAQTRLARGLPADLDRLRAAGCRTLNLSGRDVLEVCFVRGAAEFHLYVMKRDDARAIRDLRFSDEGRQTAMVWADDRYVYAAVGDGGRDALKALL
jgi:hypothetical protein